jgi:hypothetical protein
MAFKIKICILFLCIGFGFKSNAQYFINLESGALFSGSNTFREGSNGTLFSLTDDLSSPTVPFFRIRAGYLLNNKHHFSVLIAPLQLTAKGNIDSHIIFDNETFNANSALEAVYRFNSFRFTYNRRIIHKTNFNFGVGLSIKMRDAGTTLQNESYFQGDFSVGFVPLINLISNWKIADKISLQFFGDGLAAPRGRAFDLALTGNYKINTNTSASIGYRFLEGGSDGVNSYNFVTFHYAVVGFTYQFAKF